MSASDIQRWLQGSTDIAAGITLLERHGKPTNALLTILRTGAPGYARERLVEALTSVLARLQSSPASSPQPKIRQEPAAFAKSAANLIEDRDDWPLHRYPVELQEVKRGISPLLSERDTLLGELRRLPTRDERYRAALRSKEIDDILQVAFHRLDTFRKTGTDIGAVVDPPKTRVDLQRELLNIRTYLSKVSKGTRQASPEQVAAWKARRDILQTTLDAGAQE